jgi:hypothetical protein
MNHALTAWTTEDALVPRLGLPVTLLWDDPLGALALWSIWCREGKMGWLNESESGPDALELFRSVMSSPGVQHFAADTGHATAVLDLGLAPAESIEWSPLVTYEPFLTRGRRPTAEPRFDLSVCGNLYENILTESNFAADPFWVELTARVVRRKLRRADVSSYEAFRAEIEALGASERDERGLVPERLVYWARVSGARSWRPCARSSRRS